ncbi:hypothetical protein [Robiginitalea biformata]|uniref:Uncharacterized protein n=1 Tax=Robiginitalea biformata (strain ATCC BAA-864 / DSM 15991 / KCTC 12146 / HTCC2501) TaxID=313596 RepID=A4CKQ4_ROBBH|nr:hypothetical protein [Robiginitalea biformata]EAR15453.1 hypothetical protein RB2501_14034 [Robiginitalea biformata HTCC2501]
MVPFKSIISGIGRFLPVAAALAIAVLFTLWVREKNENKVIRDNFRAALAEDSALVTNYRVLSREFNDLIKVKFPALQEKLDSANIRAKRVERVVVQQIYYRDTTSRAVDLTPVVDAIQRGVKLPDSIPFTDIGPCLIIGGYVDYDGRRLTINITDRQFTSINEVVGHWRRRQWKILGLIPTRLFGRKEAVITVFNSCGESKTTVIEKLDK